MAGIADDYENTMSQLDFKDGNFKLSIQGK